MRNVGINKIWGTNDLCKTETGTDGLLFSHISRPEKNELDNAYATDCCILAFPDDVVFISTTNNVN